MLSNFNSNPYETTNHYGKWFDQLIEEFIEGHIDEDKNATDYKVSHGFFITVSFNQNRKTRDTPESELETFSRIYNWVLRQIIGRNYHRPHNKSKQPLSIACIDANGTRYWKSTGTYQNLHIHSIWIFTPEMVSKFQELISEKNWFEPLKERFDVREIDIQPLTEENRSKTGVSRVSSYTSKMIGWNSIDLQVTDDLRIFPIRKSANPNEVSAH